MMRVLIDVGHGPRNGRHGKYDPGATVDFWLEHEVMSMLCERLLEEGVAGVEIVRAPEESLGDVVRWVNERAAGSVLVSLHMNAAADHGATGVEIVVSETAPVERRRQAAVMVEALSRSLGLRNRGVKLDVDTPKGAKRGLPIVRDTRCPAFLLEVGFISNPKDIAAVLEGGADAVRDAILALQETL